MHRPVTRSAALTLLVTALAIPTSVAAAEPASSAPASDREDGYIVYMENAGEEFNPLLRVLAKDPDGTNLRVIEENAVDVSIYDPTVSPDGKKLAFNSGNEVYVMAIGKRRSLKRVETFGDFPSEAAWSPDSTEFVFTSTLPPFNDEREVLVANPKGQWRQITSTAVDEYDAAWSPDGKKIAFTAQGNQGCRDGATQRRFKDIYVSKPNGSKRKLVTGDLGYDWRIEDWGTTGILANAAYAGATGELADPCPAPGHAAHLVDPAGTTATAIMGDIDDRALALSPDETGVLFHRPVGDESVWVVGIDGADPLQIATNTWTADWAAYKAAS